jgi:hypothetical protein
MVKRVTKVERKEDQTGTYHTLNYKEIYKDTT